MNSSASDDRPKPDKVLQDIAVYVCDYEIESEEAYDTVCYCLMDALGCGLEALNYPSCTKILGPVVPGTVVPNGARVPGTSFQLDPVQAAFNIGTMVRWLDFNDTWLAAEWGHPSDNLGGILAVADYLSRKRTAENKNPLFMRDVLTAMIKAYEIQGIIALENAFNRVGLDHVILVKIATTAVTARMLNGNKEDVINALSNAFIDGHALRTYRQAPNTGSRKSWAAGDATARGVMHAMMALKGEMGYPSALTARTWGFYDALFQGKKLKLSYPYRSYVVENILFKISFPAEFHAQTAVECAIHLHPIVKENIDQIERIEITTHESAMRIINKKGPLYNPADRDHCMQYMVAIGLLFGNLTADHYEDHIAVDPRIDRLRDKMVCIESPQYSRDYLDPEKRSIPNSLQIFFKDRTKTEKVEVKYPLGHRRRRKEGKPLLVEKFKTHISRWFSDKQQGEILGFCLDRRRLEKIPVNVFVDLFSVHP